MTNSTGDIATTHAASSNGVAQQPGRAVADLRKITKTKGHFPTDDSVLKLLYMGIRNIGSMRSGAAGTGTKEWQLALNAFAIAYPDRITI